MKSTSGLLGAARHHRLAAMLARTVDVPLDALAWNEAGELAG